MNRVGASPPIPLTETFHHSHGAIRWGQRGEGPPVVFCHGTPWSSFVWHDLAGALRGRRVIVWDLLGYGRSERGERVGLDVQGVILADFLKHLELDAPDVVAHDIGGAVALRAHLLHDVAMGSMLLMDPVVLRPWGSEFFGLVRDHADVFARLPPSLHGALVTEYVLGATALNLPRDVVDQLVAPWLGEHQASFYRQIAQCSERDTIPIETRLGDVSVPTMIVWGELDRWLPVRHAARLAARIPGAEVRLVSEAGHLVMLDAPVAVHSAVGDWLALHGPAPSPRHWSR